MDLSEELNLVAVLKEGKIRTITSPIRVLRREGDVWYTKILPGEIISEEGKFLDRLENDQYADIEWGVYESPMAFALANADYSEVPQEVMDKLYDEGVKFAKRNEGTRRSLTLMQLKSGIFMPMENYHNVHDLNSPTIEDELDDLGKVDGIIGVDADGKLYPGLFGCGVKNLGIPMDRIDVGGCREIGAAYLTLEHGIEGGTFSRKGSYRWNNGRATELYNPRGYEIMSEGGVLIPSQAQVLELGSDAPQALY